MTWLGSPRVLAAHDPVEVVGGEGVGVEGALRGPAGGPRAEQAEDEQVQGAASHHPDYCYTLTIAARHILDFNNISSVIHVFVYLDKVDMDISIST